MSGGPGEGGDVDCGARGQGYNTDCSVVHCDQSSDDLGGNKGKCSAVRHCVMCM